VPRLPLTPAFCTLPPQGTLLYERKLASACTEYFSRWIDNWPERPDLESLEFTEAGVRRAMTIFHVFHFTPACVTHGVDPWHATNYTCRNFSEGELPKKEYRFYPKPSACQKRHMETLLLLLDGNEQHKSIYNFSVSRVSASKNEMVVIVRKSPRDLVRPQNVYAQAWIRPRFQLSVRTPNPQGSNLAEKLVKLWIK
jgi:hypothetical protein